MANPFGDNNRDVRFDFFGLVSDWIPVTPNDATAILTGSVGQLGVSPTTSPSKGSNNVGVALYAATAGDVVVNTPWGDDRTIPVAANTVFQTAIRGIKSTGTTATGIHIGVVY